MSAESGGIIIPHGDDGALPVSRDRLEAILAALELRLRQELVVAKDYAASETRLAAVAVSLEQNKREALTRERVAEQIREAIIDSSDRKLSITQKWGAVIAGIVIVLATCGTFLSNIFSYLASGPR